MPATFNGIPIFGAAVVMQAGVIETPRVQRNSFPGVPFAEELRMGDEGAFTQVTGRLGGPGPGGLDASEAAFRSFFDNRAYLLIDTLGRGWPGVKLEAFQPQGRVEVDPWTGYCWRSYAARFRHLLY